MLRIDIPSDIEPTHNAPAGLIDRLSGSPVKTPEEMGEAFRIRDERQT